MFKKFGKILIFVVGLVFLLPANNAKAELKMQDLLETEQDAFSGSSYIVLDQITGEVILEKNEGSTWVPASLTKVVTALVVLDQKPDYKKKCKMTPEDEVGGARITAKSGYVYKLGDLLNASLIASANNATLALADCVMSKEEFVKAMNQKAKDLGAMNTHFVEPSGIDPANTTTAEDYAKIARAGFSTIEIQNITQKKNITISTVSKPRKTHYLKSTNQILRSGSMNVVAGKTGYLDESRYNFALSSRVGNNYFITVVMGSPTQSKSFSEAKKITEIASQVLITKKSLALK